MSKIFIDTNILIYTLDKSNKNKQQRAREYLNTLNNKEHNGVLSTQIMQEFYVAATKKLNVEPLKAKSILSLLDNFETVIISREMIIEAIDCSISNVLSFWDSLIIISAEYANCEYLCTEDLNNDQVINGVKIIDPFV